MSNDFAAKLISLRSEKNLTQQQLADAIGITPSQISRYEAGLAKPRKTVLLRLAAALGIPVEDLSPEKRMRVIVGDRLPTEPPSLVRQRMFKDLKELMDTDEARQAQREAKEAGVPFEEYITNRAEQKFIKIVKDAIASGDIATAVDYRMLARLMFGTNMKIIDDDE